MAVKKPALGAVASPPDTAGTAGTAAMPESAAVVAMDRGWEAAVMGVAVVVTEVTAAVAVSEGRCSRGRPGLYRPRDPWVQSTCSSLRLMRHRRKGRRSWPGS